MTKRKEDWTDKEIEDRFWDKVEKMESGCWEWVASLTKNGYGQFRVRGRLTYVHRYSYELVNGPIPEGMSCCHKCDNPVVLIQITFL